MQRYYPHLLVVSQYSLMALMFLFLHTPLSGITLLIFIAGFIIGIWAIAHNKIGNFHVRPKLKNNAKLITTGAYRFVRHPMYLSVAVMMLSLLINTPSLIEYSIYTALLITLYLKASREEKLWLLQNKAYGEYRKNTKLFLPFLL